MSEKNAQYKNQFAAVLDELERSSMAVAVGRGIVILSKLDPNTLAYLLGECNHETITKIIVDACLTPEPGVSFHYGHLADNAKLALEGLAKTTKESREDIERQQAKTRFLNNTFPAVITATRKNKVFFGLALNNGSNRLTACWLHFTSKSSFEDWWNEGVWDDKTTKTRTFSISRSEVRNLIESHYGDKTATASPALEKWANEEP